MAQRAARLKKLLGDSKRTSDQAQKSLLKAEDALSAVEDREARRQGREQRHNHEVAQRLPGVGGGR